MEYWDGILGWNTGMEYWTGILGWNTGMEYWTGILPILDPSTEMCTCRQQPVAKLKIRMLMIK